MGRRPFLTKKCKICHVVECFRVKETGKVYCYIVENNKLYIEEVKFYETTMNELPESVKKVICDG